MSLTIYNDKLAEQEVVTEGGVVREVITRRHITDWWDADNDDGPVGLGETIKRLIESEDVPKPGDTLKTDGAGDVMPGRPLYLIDHILRTTDSNQAVLELRWEHLGAKTDDWLDVDGSLHQLQTHFDNQNPPQAIQVSHTNAQGAAMVQGVEVTVLEPRRRAVKTYGRKLNQGETASSLVGTYLGKINESPYLEGEAGTWLVTNMTVKTLVHGTPGRPALVQIKVEIEHDPRGHKQFAYWRDPMLGNVGVDLVEDEGYKRVDWHEEIEFEPEFGTG